MSEHDVLSYSLFPTIAVVLFQQSVACPDAAVDCARQDLKAKRSISQNLKVLTLRMANYSFSKLHVDNAIARSTTTGLSLSSWRQLLLSS